MHMPLCLCVLARINTNSCSPYFHDLCIRMTAFDLSMMTLVKYQKGN